jgi:hypothetical protein
MDKKYGAGKWFYAPAAVRAANITAAISQTVPGSAGTAAPLITADTDSDISPDKKRRPVHRTQSLPVSVSPIKPKGDVNIDSHEVRGGGENVLSRSASGAEHAVEGDKAVRRVSSLPVGLVGGKKQQVSDAYCPVNVCICLAL